MALKKGNQDQIEDVVRTLVDPVAIHAGMELVDVDYGRGPAGMVLKLVIDKPGGVTVDDCAYISHVVSDLLDVKEPIQGVYNLEVSSPGINRPLRKKKDFEHFAGQKVLIKTREQIDGRRRFRGILHGIEGDFILILLDKTSLSIPFENIAKARLDIV